MSFVLTEYDIRSYLSDTPPLLTDLIDPNIQIQPNGVDLSVKSISRFAGEGWLDFSNAERKLPNLIHLEFDTDGWLYLTPGCYLVQFNDVVNLPKDVMAIGRPRSSLLRMGATVDSAVWDAGYCGRSQSMLVVFNPQGVRLAKQARVLQLVFFRLSNKTGGYQGHYQGENL